MHSLANAGLFDSPSGEWQVTGHDIIGRGKTRCFEGARLQPRRNRCNLIKGFTGCGKPRVLKRTGFSPYVKFSRIIAALAAEGYPSLPFARFSSFFRSLFSRAAAAAQSTQSSAPERRRLSWQRFLILSLSCLALSAISPAQHPSAPVAGPYSIAGRVVNSATGEPVRRATVAALAEEDGHMVRSAETDADGRFTLDRLPPGKYPLTASRRGFRTAFYDEHDEYNSAIVTGPDQDTTHLVFRLMPGAVLRGVVTDDAGDPAENASVMLFRRDNRSEERRVGK